MRAYIPAASIYPESRLLLDLVDGRESTVRLFEQAPADFAAAAEARLAAPIPREALAEALTAYNRSIGASPKTFAHIEALREPGTVCVITGQQAGFLGGPAYTVYKALHAIRLAKHLEGRIGRRVVPVFWLATEDHDFTEINRVRWLEGADLKTVSFDWSGRGRPIESMPAEPETVQAAEEVLGNLPDRLAHIRALFLPEDGDDYSRWHARILSRLFADRGLIVVEPRALRHMTGEFLEQALKLAQQIPGALQSACDTLRKAGYTPALDPNKAGLPFVFSENGQRRRWDSSSSAATPRLAPLRYSPDAALRPLLADTVFPTVASILGPGEIAYQALLLPLYSLFAVSQPVIVPRHGYTVLGEAEASLLDRLGVGADEAVSPGFDPVKIAQSAASPTLRAEFAEARTKVQEALHPLQETVASLDPGLDARWRQASDHAQQAVDRLEERALSVDLARQGFSRGAMRGVAATLRPAGKPQERVLSFVHFALRYGVEWLPQLEDAGDPERFAHRMVTIQGDL